MGNATSKAARKFPKRAEPPTWTGSSGATRRPQAAEERNNVIEEDARDPHFMANLSQLGAVNVDHHMKAIRPHQKAREMIQSRFQSEQEASSMRPSRNHLPVSTLSYLFDKSKSNASRDEMIVLADKHGLDIEELESLARNFTTPSIKPDGVVRKVRGEDGEEELSVMAIWVESRALKT